MCQDELFPFTLRYNESISSAIRRLYDELDADADELSFEKLYNYRCIHDMSLGNRGVNVPSLYFGKIDGFWTLSGEGIQYYLNDLAQLESTLLANTRC